MKKDFLKSVKSSLKLKIKSAYLTAFKFKATVKICIDQMVCTTQFAISQTTAPNQVDSVIQTHQFNGNLNQIGTTKFNYLRLLIQFEYQQSKDTNGIPTSFEFEILELHLNDACFNNAQCLNNGQCISQEYTEQVNQGFRCQCKQPYEDESNCKEKDYCKNAVSI